MQSLIGTGAALITPFKEDLSIDTEALTKIVNFSVDGGVEYLVVLGTTAETATLSPADKEVVINTIVSANNGRLPLVLGIGGNDTMKVVEELKTRDLSAFEAILSVSPFYNKPTQEGIYQHYKAVAQASPLPVIIYNVPGRTSSNMLPATVLRLANDCKNIIGLKEASGDIFQAMEIIKNKPKDFMMISGDDMLALPMILAGGVGIISVIGQCFPIAFSEMVRLGLNRKVDEAYELHYRLSECIDMIFEQGNPAGIKQVFKSLGISENYLRLPLVPVDQSLAERIDAFVSKFDK
ncbi:4-hydroxy-tetrahydrodipicolinate synthase [Flavobacterium sp. UMI-01]|uniref:4-hydroxy-tetrahydrodipicolinate synthase n=1 Tax=Flavobacterium sp. UMI-01 TaxID=1441053 RepID=UPI001C7DAB3A|nr:4-hydroxy-tetrahydrodipicolinate synthase [Flavobacterium sp. UMI-01]GIZ07654.1 4-hydroxy-tetrahydrodipicolinate synthase [Flavobacterium sp. UMI-01]